MAAFVLCKKSLPKIPSILSTPCSSKDILTLDKSKTING